MQGGIWPRGCCRWGEGAEGIESPETPRSSSVDDGRNSCAWQRGWPVWETGDRAGARPCGCGRSRGSGEKENFHSERLAARRTWPSGGVPRLSPRPAANHGSQLRPPCAPCNARGASRAGCRQLWRTKSVCWTCNTPRPRFCGWPGGEPVGTTGAGGGAHGYLGVATAAARGRPTLPRCARRSTRAWRGRE